MRNGKQLNPWEWLRVEEAARLCARIIRESPTSKRRALIAYVCMQALLVDSEIPWPRRGERTKEIVRTIKAYEAGEIGEEKLSEWVHSWVAHAKQQGDATA